MQTITAEELLDFLTYVVRYEIAPRSGVSIHAINFTLSEIRAAVTEMEQKDMLYKAYLKHNEEVAARGSS